MKEGGTSGDLVSASECSWGGACIDRRFQEFLKTLFGETVMEIFQKDPEYLEDYFEFWQRFEVKKRTFESKQNDNKNVQKEKYQSKKNVFQIQIPLANVEIVAKQNKQGYKRIRIDAVINEAIKTSQYRNDLTFENGKLIIKSSFFEQCFTPTIEILINHLKKLYNDIGGDLKGISNGWRVF